MIDRIEIQPYALPLRRTWGSARGGFDCRRGWLIRIDASGMSGFGDCAPLPAAGTERDEQAWATLTRWRREAPGRRPQDLLAAIDAEQASSPSAVYALECALSDLLSRREGSPLRHWLSADAPDLIPVNALLGVLGSDTGDAAQSSLGQGFRVLKLKVGLDTPEHELERLAALARQLPAGTTLRLDANGAWAFDEAERMIQGLAGLPIESLEEPLRAPDPERLAELQARAAYPIALDESLPARIDELDLAALGVRRLVLKPAALGGLRGTQHLAQRAMSAGIQVVITSVVESAAGLWPTVQLAAAIASPIPQGLATADWLARDLGATPRIEQGWIKLTSRPGSGFAPTPCEKRSNNDVRNPDN